MTTKTYASTFETNYRWQLQYQGDVRQIVTSTFALGDADITFTTPDSEDDRRYNTDIWIWLNGRPRRMSQRIRRYVVGDDFTLRYEVPGSTTEWQKLWAGFGDFIFYGRGTSSGTVENWFIGAMDVFKEWASGFFRRGAVPPHKVNVNKDGSSSFVSFSRSDLPSEFVVAQDEDADIRDACWAIVKDGRGMNQTGHGSAVRWARARLGLDES